MTSTLCESATPSSLNEELVNEIDRVFSDLQKLNKMGDYVKFDTVADMILDIRSKAIVINQ